MHPIVRSLAGGLVVSCQAKEKGPLDHPMILSAFAEEAEQAGAVGIRANCPRNIEAIKKAVGVPVIGILKKEYRDSDVYITPTFEEVRAIVNAGADLIAMDATNRPRPGDLTLQELLHLTREYTDIPLMADIATFEEAKLANDLGFDIIATTLMGYTAETADWVVPNRPLVRDMVESFPRPIIVEGRIHSPQQATEMLHLGAHAVVVGTAITNPFWITSQFVRAIQCRV